MKLVTRTGLALLVAVASGCAARHPLVVWQQQLTKYVEKQGNGDPNVIRDTVDLHSRHSPRPGRITFAALGIRGPGLFPFAAASDVQGVFVGLSELDSRHWFVFLVGVVKQHPHASAGLEDLRVAAFVADGAGLHWRVGAADAGALARYMTAVQQQEPARGVRARNPAFPGHGDVFQLRVADSTVVVTEAQSGATWELQLGREEPKNAGSVTSDRQLTTPPPNPAGAKSALPNGRGRR